MKWLLLAHNNLELELGNVEAIRKMLITKTGQKIQWNGTHNFLTSQVNCNLAEL